MDCPYCGKKMEKGEFRGTDGLAWLPDNQQGFWKSLFSFRNILFREKGKWYDASYANHIPACHCPACRKFIFNGKLHED